MRFTVQKRIPPDNLKKFKWLLLNDIVKLFSVKQGIMMKNNHRSQSPPQLKSGVHGRDA